MVKTLRDLITPFNWWDCLIYGLALILTASSYWYCWIETEDCTEYAVIHSPGHPALKIDLQQNQEIHVTGALGESILEIAAGRIRFIKSPCHNQYCVHNGWLSKTNRFTACLPNQISIELHSADTVLNLDGISH